LVQKGLKEMEAIGTPFDADIHEAITNIPAPTDDLKGKVVDQMEKGYYLNDKVVRFAKVIVGA
jgi:molecular chaperone GrpE